MKAYRIAAPLLALALLTSAEDAPKPAPAASDAIPVEAFAELPVMETPRLSPDGTRIAAKMAIGGVQRLVVAPLMEDGRKPVVLGVAEKVDINWWRWVGDNWLAVGVGAESSFYGETAYVTRTIGVEATTARHNMIDWKKSGLRADDVLWAARDGTPRILLARQTGIETLQQFYPEVVEADLSTGRTRVVVPGREDVRDWFADASGQVRMGYRFSDRVMPRGGTGGANMSPSSAMS